MIVISDFCSSCFLLSCSSWLILCFSFLCFYFVLLRFTPLGCFWILGFWFSQIFVKWSSSFVLNPACLPGVLYLGPHIFTTIFDKAQNMNFKATEELNYSRKMSLMLLMIDTNWLQHEAHKVCLLISCCIVTINHKQWTVTWCNKLHNKQNMFSKRKTSAQCFHEHTTINRKLSINHPLLFCCCSDWVRKNCLCAIPVLSTRCHCQPFQHI